MIRKPTALVIDDEQSICESLAGVLSDEGWETITANSGKQGLVEFKLRPVDVVLLDVWMPGMDGIATLQALKELSDAIPVVIMSGHGTIETAVKATKLGAFDFLEKPLSLDKILPILNHAVGIREHRGGAPSDAGRIYRLIGESPHIHSIKKQIEMVAPRNSWVLITGENGTGKEVVARNIHYSSSRSDRPFVAVNCAAIPENLIESELFGHVKGAFTGAVNTKRGKFELANQGTLFLDEIGDMGLRTQAKILRILQEQQFERLGDQTTLRVDVRVIAATNKDLKELISTGEFREDLFYRLNVIPFHLAPLRERAEDVIILANHFLADFSKELDEPKKKLTPEVSAAFQTYQWPGNIRELRNLIERLCIMVRTVDIKESDLPEGFLDGEEGGGGESRFSFPLASTLKEAKSDFERSFIIDKLQENHWNVSKTAEAIGIERSNLHRKLRAFDIDPKRLKG